MAVIGSPTTACCQLSGEENSVRSIAEMPAMTVTKSVIPKRIQPVPAAAGSTQVRLARAMWARAVSAPRGVAAAPSSGVPREGGRWRRSCARICCCALSRSARSGPIRAVVCNAATSVMPSSREAGTRRRTRIQASGSASNARHQEDRGPAPSPLQGCGRPSTTVSGSTATTSAGGSISTAVVRVAISSWNCFSVRKRRG